MAPLAYLEGTQVGPQLDEFDQGGYLCVVLCTSARVVVPPGAVHCGEAQYNVATEVRIRDCSASSESQYFHINTRMVGDTSH